MRERIKTLIPRWTPLFSIAALFFGLAAAVLLIGSRLVERRETLIQRVPAIQAELVGELGTVTLPELTIEIDRPVRMIRGGESEFHAAVTVNGEPPVGDVASVLMSQLRFTNAALTNSSAFFDLDSGETGHSSTKIRPVSEGGTIVGEWLLTELFFASETGMIDADAALDRWVRVSKGFELRVVGFMGLDWKTANEAAIGAAVIGALLAGCALGMRSRAEYLLRKS